MRVAQFVSLLPRKNSSRLSTLRVIGTCLIQASLESSLAQAQTMKAPDITKDPTLYVVP